MARLGLTDTDIKLAIQAVFSRLAPCFSDPPGRNPCSPLTPLSVIAIQLLLYVVLAGCRHVTSSELPGEYSVTMPWGGSNLALRANHTMEEEVHTRDGHSEKVSGTWQENKGYVFIKPCLPVRLADHVRTEICGFAAEVVGFRRIELSIDSVYDLAYTKR
jgi:hypothetical protein